MGSINASNAIVILGATGQFPAFQLDGFSTDDVFSSAAITIAETTKGVDGKKSSGFINALVPTDFHLQADSNGNPIFEEAFAAQIAGRMLFVCFGSVTIPDLGRTYILNNGTLKTGTALPSAGKVLKPRVWSFDWESAFSSAV